LTHSAILLEDDNPLIPIISNNHLLLPVVADSRRLQKALSHTARICAVAQRRDTFTFSTKDLNAIVSIVADCDLPIASHGHATRPLHVSSLLPSSSPNDSGAGAIQIENYHPIVSTICNIHALAVRRHCNATGIFKLPFNLSPVTNHPENLARGI
jgi:hypothetical protein